MGKYKRHYVPMTLYKSLSHNVAYIPTICTNSKLRSGPILAVLIHSLQRLPLKLGLIQTLSRLCSLRPDFGRNADWLLEQCHKIWLAVVNAGSWKRLFLAWLFSWMIRRRRREGSILLSFFIVLWSCGRKIWRFVSGSLFVSPCTPECNFQSETKVEPDLRLH